MNDYGTSWPLWWIEGGHLEPGELDVTTELQDGLRAWARQFGANFDPFRGWSSPRIEREHRETGERLLLALREEIEPLEVVPDFWEHQ